MNIDCTAMRVADAMHRLMTAAAAIGMPEEESYDAGDVMALMFFYAEL